MTFVSICVIKWKAPIIYHTSMIVRLWWQSVCHTYVMHVANCLNTDNVTHILW